MSTENIMACFEYGTIVDLAPRETVTLPDVRGATLRLTRGTVWITQENDTQDIVLRTGDSWTVERDGLTIVEAQDQVSLCVVGRRMASLFTGQPPRATRSALDRAVVALAAFFARPARGPAPYY
jgi:hypothetical protein